MDGVVFKLRSLDPSQQGGETEKKFWANLSVTRVVPFLCVLHIGSLYKILFNGPLIFFFFFENSILQTLINTLYLVLKYLQHKYKQMFETCHSEDGTSTQCFILMSWSLSLRDYGAMSQPKKKKKRKITEGIFP